MTIRFRQSHNRATTPSQLRIWGIWGDEMAPQTVHIAGYGRLVVGVIRVGMLWSAEGATGHDLGDGPLQR
jgi:hypothetical protein